MKDAVQSRKVFLLVLCSSMLFALKIVSLFLLFEEKMGTSVYLSMVLITPVILCLTLTLIGIANRRSWALNTFLLAFFAILPTFLLGFIHIWKFHWAYYPFLLLEVFCFLTAMIQLIRLPKDFWKPNTSTAWKKLLRPDFLTLPFFLLALLEFGLFSLGISPSVIQGNPYFHPVDSLVVWQDYSADEYGLTHVNAQGAELAANGTWLGKERTKESDPYRTYSFSTISIFEDWTLLREAPPTLPFAHLLADLKQRPDTLLDELDRAHLEFLNRPINSHGYRSIPFKNYATDRPTVLLLGDSFTFGWSARPWFGSFADHLRALGYVVYNAGISGTGPDQYAAAAKVFIPMLKPDYVIVNFFVGNDILYFPVETKPYEMVYYPTNAGVMMARPTYERIPTAEEAFQFYLNQYYIPLNSFFNKFCAYTSVGSIFWRLGKRFSIFQSITNAPNQEYFERNLMHRSTRPVSEAYLLEIEALCQQEGSQFVCSIIPDLKNLRPDLDKDYPDLFQSITPVIIQLSEKDYNLKDTHFNLQGHERYSRFLDSLMRSIPAN
ncbi:SGNH/GDSL hydrolase family protein [Lewinella sp. LCG006]|uniref:SGNH/GDSL hydrolase family protein n=1 Tax=Lewinella sp. LCG006 TaxID=3231911 RepID=UPI003460A1F1